MIVYFPTDPGYIAINLPMLLPAAVTHQCLTICRAAVLSEVSGTEVAMVYGGLFRVEKEEITLVLLLHSRASPLHLEINTLTTMISQVNTEMG